MTNVRAFAMLYPVRAAAPIGRPNPIKQLGLTLILLLLASHAFGATWYVDAAIGGSRFSVNEPTGLCDGTVDAAPVGKTPNQHCAFSDVRYLWQDASYTTGTSFPSWGWIGAGGDTYMIMGSIATGSTNRIGATWPTPAVYDGWGIAGNGAASGAPPPPSGKSTQHTRILGQNFASCTSQTARTQLHGGAGVGTVLALNGSSYVDAACLDITDFSACGRSSQKLECENAAGQNVEDYAGNGISFNNASNHVTLTDVRVHGLSGAGLYGATGDGTVLTRIDILGNANSGWNADDNSGTTGVGSLLVQNFTIIGNGCAEEYPVVDSMPYGDCTDQSSGGYGDGFGTATVASAAPGWQVHFDQGTVAYNTQDGLDALHISGPGSTMTDTRVLAYGNEGQQLKVGGAAATIQNSVIVGNCEAMTQGPIPGFPVGFGSALAAPCRAGNTAIALNVTPGDPAVFQNNSIFEEGSIGVEVEYATSDIGVTNTLKYNNNVFVGFFNTGNQANATPIFSSTDLNMLTNAGASWTNNATFGQRSNWTCPHAGESAALCADPGLTDETYHTFGFGNMVPGPGSAVIGAGVAIAGITTDFTGALRPSKPAIGAYEQDSSSSGGGGTGGGGTGTGGGTPPPPPPPVITIPLGCNPYPVTFGTTTVILCALQ